MAQTHFTSVWAALSPTLRSQDACRRLAAEQVDEMVAAGGRDAHSLWFDSRPGHPRQWATTWQFGRFIEHHPDIDEVA